MLNLEDIVKDMLETEYAIEEKIEEATGDVVREKIDSWMRIHSLNSYIADALNDRLNNNEVSDAIEYAIAEFVDELT